MATGKEIKRRIKSIRNTSKITKAMELISTVKMKKAQDLALEKKEYIRGILEVIMNLNGSLPEHRYFNSPNSSSKTLGIVVTSNKGLCGGYNINVMKKINEYVKANGNNIEFITLGKRGAQFIARTGNKLIADHSDHFGDNIYFHFSKQISRSILEKFNSGNYDKVVVFYNHFVNTIKQVNIAREILPFTDKSIENYIGNVLGQDYIYKGDDNISEYLFEPNIEELIDEVMPMLFDSMFFDILIESKASEHSARMIAMKNAKDNANKYASKLVLQYNKARQAAITKEVSEIVSGVEAMKD